MNEVELGRLLGLIFGLILISFVIYIIWSHNSYVEKNRKKVTVVIVDEKHKDQIESLLRNNPQFLTEKETIIGASKSLNFAKLSRAPPRSS